MPDNEPTPPWQLCDTAARTALAACRLLDEARERHGLSFESLAALSGLSLMSVTRTMRGAGCNLAEFMCLTAALGQSGEHLLYVAADHVARPQLYNPAASS